MVKDERLRELLRLLREKLGLRHRPRSPTTTLDDVGDEWPHRALRPYPGADRCAPRASGDGTAVFDHPLLSLEVAGHEVFLEPDLIAFQVGGRLHVVEIKSFAIVDGQADGEQVSAAAVQAAVYVLALRDLLAELGHDPERSPTTWCWSARRTSPSAPPPR